MTLKQIVSNIIGAPVENIGWDEAFKRAQVTGKMTNAQTVEIIREICKRLEPYVPDHIYKPQAVNEQVSVFNPLKDDFTVSFDFDGSGQPITFTAHAQELTKFDQRVAAHVKKHLIPKVLQSRGKDYFTPEDTQKVDAEISM